MPYCTIEEAWGISPENNSPIDPKIGSNVINNIDKTSRNYTKLENYNGNDRYSRNKGSLEINLDESPIVKTRESKKKKNYDVCANNEKIDNGNNPVVMEEQMAGPILNKNNQNIKRSIYNDDVIENFDLSKVNKLLSENKYLKEQLSKNNNPNSELILFTVMGIFLLYIFELFIRIGKK